MRVETFDNYPSALDALAKKLCAHVFSPYEYTVVLCPDRYTQSVECALFSGRGAIDCEVLTLSRLSRRIAPSADVLTKEGGVMLTARAVAAVKDKLRYYGRAAKYGDFARSVYETLQQTAASDTDVSELRGTGATAEKLRDLALIKAEYDRIKVGRDSVDRMTALIEHARNAPLVKNSVFYAIGFSDTTKLNRRALAAIAAASRSFVCYEAKRAETPRYSIDLFSAPDKVSEYKYIAAQIRKFVRNGGSYADVSVINTSPRTLIRVFGEYGIPVYTDETGTLAETPALCALENIYRLHTSATERNAVDCAALTALCKNPFSGCSDIDAERLLHTVGYCGLSYLPADFKFDDFGAARAADRAAEIVGKFGSAPDFASAVNRVVEFCAFDKTVNRLGAETDTVAPILALTELSEKFGSGSFDTDAALFFSSARAVNVNSLPRRRDCVTVTTPETLRLTACKALFVTDFNEGILPSVVSDTGLLGDAELKQLGGVVEPSVLQKNIRSRDELKAVIRNADHVMCAYSTAGGARPAVIIKELAENIVFTELTERNDVLLDSDDPKFIAECASVPAAAREIALCGMSKHAFSLSAAAGESGAAAAPFECSVGVISDKKSISVSELSHWFKCPYMRFLSDRVGLEERRNGPGAPDFGIIVHEFMRRFIDEKNFDCSRDRVSALIDEILAEKDMRPAPAVYSRITEDAVDYAVLNTEIIRAGGYNHFETEYRFGGKLRFGEKIKERGGEGLEFIGFIDRIDRCGGRVRIMDYKTGNKKFATENCVNGCDMQLPLYAAAADGEVTGMFYVKLPKRYGTGKRERVLDGCMIKNADIAKEYDKSLAPGVSSEIVPVRFKTSKTGECEFSGKSASVLDREDFDRLIRLCVANADVAADEIVSGYINRSPIEGACDHCAYRGICGGGKIYPRTGSIVDADSENADE